jgi:2-keto-4-pentenoate hydratase/2-oxohepta-3-ene-1,7-dioic acid hydratase in catechol pathway
MSMQFLRFREGNRLGVAVAREGENFIGWRDDEAGFPGDLDAALLSTLSLGELAERLEQGSPVDLGKVQRLLPVGRPGKILCIGLNYRGHAQETRQPIPDFPTVFARFDTSLVGDGNDLVRPKVSELFDYEGELVVVIGKRGRHIARDNALQHVAGYTVGNDGSIRDYQLRSTQWGLGKNFDQSGAIGPFLVSAAALPLGATGLRVQTRLNGAVLQDSNTDDLIFDVATLVTLLSEVMTLEPGDLIVTGTPSGVAMARNPPPWMKVGDLCEVEIEGVGLLRNRIVDEG